MRFAAPALALLLAASVAPAAGDAPGGDLDALLARVREASGAPYAHHIVSRFKDVEAGRSYDVEVETDGYRLLVHRCRTVVCDGVYFDGERAFDLNLNDTALPRGSANDVKEERTLRAVDTLAFTAPDFHATGGAVAELADVRHEGRALRRVAVSTSGGGAIDVLIDGETARVIATAQGDGKVVDEFRDFRKVGTLTLPFEIWHADERERLYDTREVSDAPFVAPAGVAPAFAGAVAPIAIQSPPGDRPGSLPQPVVPCAFGGIRVLCLVDTGNSSLGISLELAERLGVEPSGEYVVAGLGNYVTGIVSAGPLRVGNATYPPAKYVVLHDLHDYGYDVVLGTDAFAHATITLDYARATIAFAPPGGTTQGTAIPLRFQDFVPIVHAQLGAFDALLAVDTGDEAAINVSKSYYDAHPALFVPSGTREVSGIGGEGEQVVGMLQTVRIGTFEVLQQPIAATASAIETASGHVGSAFLSNFAVIFDYASARFSLVPRPGDTAVRTVE
jgi:hypothetical protein